jgi:hypothetical protein
MIYKIDSGNLKWATAVVWGVQHLVILSNHVNHVNPV